MVENYRERIERYLDIEDPDRALLDALTTWPAEEAESAHVRGRLLFPAPLPASWVAESLMQVDRALRWAVRATEDEVPVGELLDRRARPVGTRFGLIVTQVEPGSFDFLSEGSERVYQALSKKPIVLTLALISALQLLGLNPHIEFTDDHPAPPAAPNVEQHVDVVNEPHFTIILVVDGQQVRVKCQPPPPDSRGWRAGGP